MDHTDVDQERFALEAVIDALSSDSFFLLFLEKLTHSYVSPLSPKYLPWLATAPVDRQLLLDADDEGATAMFLSRSSACESWSLAHYDAFEMYSRVFETRLECSLRQLQNRFPNDAILCTPARIVDICQNHLEAEPVESANEEKGGLPTVTQLCKTFLSMVEAAASFEQFAVMLSERQYHEFETLLSDNNDDED